MSMTDPIADLLTRIRNAIIAKHDRLDVPASKQKLAICRVLEEQGYIKGFRVHDDNPPGKSLEIILKYTKDGTPVIRNIERVSKPGRRVYRGASDLRPVLNGIGVAIVSTPQGLLSDAEARARRVGGEVLCQIY
ncbi:MAG: 30S ribosomal protein S8 [Acidobacteria bacterium]|nr:MAG: 30S ribosomal protein S8 [Acidobacteriota bacterium]REK07125.1 MAG: 30S ribosomal protein S8 [Acidobacteriota bacterium]